MLHCQPAPSLKAFCLALCLTSAFAVQGRLKVYYQRRNTPEQGDFAAGVYELNPVDRHFTCTNVAGLEGIPARYRIGIGASLDQISLDCRVSLSACKAGWSCWCKRVDKLQCVQIELWSGQCNQANSVVKYTFPFPAVVDRVVWITFESFTLTCSGHEPEQGSADAVIRWELDHANKIDFGNIEVGNALDSWYPYQQVRAGTLSSRFSLQLTVWSQT